MGYLLLVVAIAVNATANILMKLAAGAATSSSPFALITNPWAVAGVVLFASNVYLYIQTLRLFPVSLVYPVMTAAGFLLINAYGILVLKEPFSLQIFLGYAALLFGIGLIVTAYR